MPGKRAGMLTLIGSAIAMLCLIGLLIWVTV
jgi:hypothetical protein